MISDAIINLKERNGSRYERDPKLGRGPRALFVYTQLTSLSRVALKKYVKANNNLSVSDNQFDALFNKAIRSGVEKGVFAQPKGR